MGKLNLFLDSGAFTAHRKGKEVSFKGYVDFITKYLYADPSYACLDVIPKSAHQAEDAATQTYRNWRAMRKLGLNPLPVFHFGERFYWFERYVGEGAGCVGLGGIAADRTTLRYEWLDGIFDWKRKNARHIRIHGFGLSDLGLVGRYPFHSVDSSTWVLKVSYGKVSVPSPGKGMQPDYRCQPLQVRVSNKGCPSDNFVGQNGRILSDYVRRFAEDEGYTLEQLAGRGHYRMELSARCFLRMDLGAELYLVAANWHDASVLLSEGCDKILISYAYERSGLVARILANETAANYYPVRECQTERKASGKRFVLRE